MIPNKYPKPPLDLSYWCVSRKDLFMIYQFLVSRFPGQPIDIILETQRGNNKIYENFDEFSEDLEVVLSLDDTVLKIFMLCREVKSQSERKFIWFVAEFLFNTARFNIFANDKNGECKEWVDSSYKEMQSLFQLFLPEKRFIEILKRDFHNYHPDRRENTAKVVVLDFDGNIRNRIFNEIQTGVKQDYLPPAKINLRWIRNANIWLAIVVALVILGLLLLSFR